MSDDVASDNLTRFWGKVGAGGGARGYHPLICHMIDVAAVAELMWDAVLSPAAKDSVGRGLGMKDAVATRAWVAFLAGAHDLGKGCPAFQLRPQAKALSRLYSDLVRPYVVPPPGETPHGTVTAVALPKVLREHQIDPEVAQLLATVVGGHHGAFPRRSERQAVARRTGVGGGMWEQARRDVIEELAALLDLLWQPAPAALDPPTAMLLAGLVSVADWIGSDRRYFDYAMKTPAPDPSLSLPDYTDLARKRAADALDVRGLGWLGWKPPEQRRTFDDLFHETIPSPNDLQRQVEVLAQHLGDGPRLLVIEAPMGEGKTEAAFYVADTWGVKPGPRGMYVALPTQATSDQMLSRVKKFLSRRYEGDVVNLMLLHGQAALSPAFEELLEPEPTEYEGDAGSAPSDARVRAAAWFTKRKRGLLAPFGVGTVDQALLAALQTRHVFVRLTGLAHKVVVIDEVHAYDAYMTTLLERVLAWLGALGSPVVLLSATLPPQRRDALVSAYARGAGIPAASIPAAAYPRLTWVARPDATREQPTGSVQVEASDHARRRLAVRWVNAHLPEPKQERFPPGEQLEEALHDGGCAAVICNTVSRSQAIYRRLKKYFPDKADDGEPELGLLHAHFLYDERDKREKRALLRFGKQGTLVDFAGGDRRPVQRPRRAVLVSTQIIEQSLDLDFDLMVTDFAPIDLLLQRSGRLHRHQRGKNEADRPLRLRKPSLWICQPVEEDGRPIFEGGDASIYDPHVLLRTWLELRRIEAGGELAIAIPNDVDGLVCHVYDEHIQYPADAGEALRAMWEQTEERLRRKRGEWRRLAASKAILSPETAVEDLLNDWNMQLEEEEPEINLGLQALTRVEEQPSVSAVLLPYSAAGSLDWRRKPDREETRRLLGWSVRLSGHGLVGAVMKWPTPRGWQKSPMLRNHHLVQLDAEGAASLGGYRLQLSETLGVVIEHPSGRQRS